MPSKLRKLIGAIETDKAALEIQIQECLAEQEYHLAHHFSKEVRRLTQQLHALHTFLDPLFEAKELARNRIARIVKLAASKEEKYLADYLDAELAKEQAKLQQLVRQQSAPNRLTGSTVLRDTFRLLLRQQLMGFNLVLDSQCRLECTVRLARKTIIVTLPEVRRHRAAYTLDKRRINKLKGLGFGYYDQKDKLLLIVPFFAEEDISTLQTLIARMIFEVFNFREPNGETFIRYW
jgi:hypothetical protein